MGLVRHFEFEILSRCKAFDLPTPTSSSPNSAFTATANNATKKMANNFKFISNALTSFLSFEAINSLDWRFVFWPKHAPDSVYILVSPQITDSKYFFIAIFLMNYRKYLLKFSIVIIAILSILILYPSFFLAQNRIWIWWKCVSSFFREKWK